MAGYTHNILFGFAVPAVHARCCCAYRGSGGSRWVVEEYFMFELSHGLGFVLAGIPVYYLTQASVGRSRSPSGLKEYLSGMVSLS
jgi:hypothetical protein